MGSEVGIGDHCSPGPADAVESTFSRPAGTGERHKVGFMPPAARFTRLAGVSRRSQDGPLQSRGPPLEGELFFLVLGRRLGHADRHRLCKVSSSAKGLELSKWPRRDLRKQVRGKAASGIPSGDRKPWAALAIRGPCRFCEERMSSLLFSFGLIQILWSGQSGLPRESGSVAARKSLEWLRRELPPRSRTSERAPRDRRSPASGCWPFLSGP